MSGVGAGPHRSRFPRDRRCTGNRRRDRGVDGGKQLGFRDDRGRESAGHLGQRTELARRVLSLEPLR